MENGINFNFQIRTIRIVHYKYDSHSVVLADLLYKTKQYYQWSTEPKQYSVLFGIRFGSARFGSALSGKTEPNIYRIKSKIKEV